MDFLAMLIKLLFDKKVQYVPMRNMRLEDMVIIDVPTDVQLVFGIDWSVLFSDKAGEFFDKQMSVNNLFVGVKDDIIYITQTNVSDKTYNCGYYYTDAYSTLNAQLIKPLVNQGFADLLIELLGETKTKKEAMHKQLAETIKIETIEKALTGLSSNLESRLNDLKRRLEEYKNQVASYRTSLVNASNQAQQAAKDIASFNIDGEKDVIRKEIANIANHKKVVQITYENGYLCVYTVPLYLFEPIEKERFYLGKMVIKIKTSDGSIRFDNLDNRRDGYWRNSPHPHVDGDGYGCLGNIDGQVADAFTRKQYYVLFITLLGYLETCNIADCAGAKVYAWDKVDDTGDVVEAGEPDCEDDWGDDDYAECVECGERHHVDDMYECTDCEGLVCEEHVVFIEVEGHDYPHCPYCAEENH